MAESTPKFSLSIKTGWSCPCSEAFFIQQRCGATIDTVNVLVVVLVFDVADDSSNYFWIYLFCSKTGGDRALKTTRLCKPKTVCLSIHPCIYVPVYPSIYIPTVQPSNLNQASKQASKQASISKQAWASKQASKQASNWFISGWIIRNQWCCFISWQLSSIDRTVSCLSPSAIIIPLSTSTLTHLTVTFSFIFVQLL